MEQVMGVEPAVQGLAVDSLLAAIRRIAARAVAEPFGDGVAGYRRVERLMRMAIALSGAGHLRPLHVQVHDIGRRPDELPELLSVNLTDLLAARAADHLADALAGDPEACEALGREAESILLTEDVQFG